jgi:hypothetical protein
VSYPSPKQAKERVNNEPGTIVVLPAAPAAPSVLWVRFTDFGRVAESSKPVRELRSSKTTTIEEEPRGLGLVIDGHVLVPWSNISWVEYAP